MAKAGTWNLRKKEKGEGKTVITGRISIWIHKNEAGETIINILIAMALKVCQVYRCIASQQ